jgi:hypothetical protein
VDHRQDSRDSWDEQPKEPEPRKTIASRLKAAMEKFGLAPKDVITITLSLSAFVLSAMTAYFNVIRRVDDVRVIVSGDPRMTFYGENLEAGLPRKYALIFFNTGSRSAVILDHSFVFAQLLPQPLPDSKPSGSKCGQNANTFDSNLKPFVIKEKEVIVKDIIIGGRGDFNRRTEQELEGMGLVIKVTDVGQFSYDFRVCLVFGATTPSTAHHTREIQVSHNVLSKRPMDYEVLNPISIKRPVKIVDEGGTIFDN